jgi:hypothetical protein
MNRRLLALGILAVAAAPAAASGPPASDAPAPTLDLPAIGLPVIDEGRLRNYVFISLRLHLAPGTDAQAVRAKAPQLRDILVRMAHRSRFAIPGEWTQLDAGRIAGAIMGAAPAVVGAGKIVRVEISSQTPQRRTGMRSAR